MDAATPTEAATPVKKRPPGVLLFRPGPLTRTEVVQWLKRIHAWTGLWGALAFLLIGISGFTLNHRATLKINTGEPAEVMSVTLPVDPTQITRIEDLGVWAQRRFGTSLAPRAPRGERAGDGQTPGQTPGQTRGQIQSQIQGQAEGRGAATAGGEAEFMGKRVRPADVWRQSFTGPHAVLTVEYTPGGNTVKATRSEQNLFGTLKNLHKGVGLSMGWVLFIDTMAGGLIAMSLTGALLWSRLHGPRLAAIGLVLASFGLALTAAWPSLL